MPPTPEVDLFSCTVFFSKQVVIIETSLLDIYEYILRLTIKLFSALACWRRCSATLNLKLVVNIASDCISVDPRL